jgi:MerR family transcriptional regulator, redox-sensitive transcriptional activator SoxR
MVTIPFRGRFGVDARLLQPKPKFRSSIILVPNMKATDIVSIGDLARRTGLSISAIRFYERKGLIEPFRSAGGQRRFLRSDIRRLSFIRIAQTLGLSIEGIAAELARLPHQRTPTAADWAKISRAMRSILDDKIAMLERTRDRLDGCIGCGCLSLKKCALYNPDDRVAARGAGPRLVMNS